MTERTLTVELTEREVRALVRSVGWTIAMLSPLCEGVLDGVAAVESAGMKLETLMVVEGVEL